MKESMVFDGILEGLEEAVAYKQGNTSRCKVSVREVPVPEYKA